jgi:hypothetical protein
MGVLRCWGPESASAKAPFIPKLPCICATSSKLYLKARTSLTTKLNQAIPQVRSPRPSNHPRSPPRITEVRTRYEHPLKSHFIEANICLMPLSEFPNLLPITISFRSIFADIITIPASGIRKTNKRKEKAKGHPSPSSSFTVNSEACCNTTEHQRRKESPLLLLSYMWTYTTSS